ncbi:MAG: Wzz/FepE/Etk N-terminal domain-containing protein, partial [Janthinobacterium lividum]
MDLRGYLKVLQRRWISILVITLATLAVAAAVTFALTPKYTSSTRLFFGVQGAQSGS